MERINDLIFIVICAMVFFLIEFCGYGKILATYSIIWALAAYFTGKYIGKSETKKKLSQNNIT